MALQLERQAEAVGIGEELGFGLNEVLESFYKRPSFSFQKRFSQTANKISVVSELSVIV